MGRHKRARGQERARLAATVALLALCLPAVIAAAQEVGSLAELLPEHTLLYVSIRNPSGQESFRDSALGRITREPEMRAFLESTGQELARLLDAQAPQLPVDPRLIQELLRGEVSVAFTGLQVAEAGAPVPGVVLSVVFQRPAREAEEMWLAALRRAAGGQFGDPAPAFEHEGATVKALAVPDGRLLYAFVGQRLLATMGEADMRAMLNRAAGKGPPPAEGGKFQKVMESVSGADSMFCLYADTEGLLMQFGMMIPPPVSQALRGVGLYGVRAVGVSSRFADGGIRDSLYLYAPGERSGILPPAGAPVDPGLLRLVPEDAEMVSLFRLDAERIYQEVMRTLSARDPEAFEQVAARIGELEERIGFRVRQDLLASLGTQYLLFTAPHESILMVEVKDRERLEACIGSLVDLAEGGAVLKRMGYGGALIRYLCVTGLPLPISPSYTFHGRFAVFALYPQTLKAFLVRLEEDGPSVLDNEDFQRVAGKFLEGCDAVGYQDIRGGLTDFYSLLTIAAPAAHGIRPVSLQPELLPPPRVVEPHMFGMGTGCINDADGILYECFSPLGSAGGLLAALGSMRSSVGLIGPNVTTSGILAGMLMPALTRARGEARKAACMANLHSIGLGIMLYVNDHDEWPQSLADLFPDYVEADDAFLCPRDQSPMDIGAGLRSSYHYVGRLSQLTSLRVIIICDKRGNHPGGRNALFVDGHVEWIPEGRLRERLAESLRLVKEVGWDEYSPERQGAIEAFYTREALE